MRKMKFDVRLRQVSTGEEHNRQIFAQDEAIAKERAVARARSSIAKTMVEREYGQFEVLSCTPAAVMNR
jgi:hypothetical protein